MPSASQYNIPPEAVKLIPNSNQASPGSYSIVKKFAYLFSAYWFREILQGILLIYLARNFAITFGQFILAINIGQIMLFVAEFGLNQHLATLLARKTNYPTAILLQVSLVKSLLLSLSWLGMLIFIFWQNYDSDLKWLIVILATGVALDALASSFFVTCQVLGRQDVESRLQSLGAFLGFGYGITTLLLGFHPLTISAYKLIETCTSLSGVAIILLRRVRRGTVSVGWRDFKLIWMTWRGSITYTLMAIAAILYNKINIFFLQKFAGSNGVANYSVTWQVVDGISIMISGMLLRKILFPLLIKLWIANREEFSRLVRNTASWLFTVAVFFTFILYIESDRIILLVFGDKYCNAVWMQKYLAGTILFAFLHNLAHYIMISIQRERLLLIFYLLGLAFNMTTCAILIPGNPLLGSVVSILATKIFVAAMTVLFCQLTLHIIPLYSFLQIIAAMGLCASLYYLGTTYVLREIGEILALLPIGTLAWCWRKRLTVLTNRSM
ncbi:Polysaccharide biosynthesis protein [Desulfovibrionales bacterium]